MKMKAYVGLDVHKETIAVSIAEARRIRAQHSATKDLRIAKSRIQSFLLKYQRSYDGKTWTKKYRLCLANLQFSTKAQQVAAKLY